MLDPWPGLARIIIMYFTWFCTITATTQLLRFHSSILRRRRCSLRRCTRERVPNLNSGTILLCEYVIHIIISLTFSSPSVSPSLSVAVKNVTNDIAVDTSVRTPGTIVTEATARAPKSSEPPMTVTTTTSATAATTTKPTVQSSPKRFKDTSNDGIVSGWPSPSLPHDFSDCCRSMNVSHKCMRYCSVHTIFNRSTHYVHASDSCIQDFVHIVKCTAGGRNHVPCCQKKNIPDLCQVSEMHTHYDIIT